MRLITDYILGKFFKELFVLSIFFTFILLFFQVFNISYLFFSLPPKKIIPYAILWVIYTFFLSVAVSVPIVLAGLIFSLKEERFFHILNTFGFSEKVVFRRLLLGILSVSVMGVVASFFVNYQKISFITKYLKYQYGERLLLSIPKQSFFQGQRFSFYFGERNENRFERILVKTPEEIASALKGELTPEGILCLKKFSLFSGRRKSRFFARGDKYEVSLLGAFYYKFPKKKLIENFVFLVVLFLFPLFAFPFMFKIFLKKTETRFKTYLTAFGFVLLQFILAVLIKSIV